MPPSEIPALTEFVNMCWVQQNLFNFVLNREQEQSDRGQEDRAWLIAEHSLGSMVYRACPAAELMQWVFFGDKLLRGLLFADGLSGCARLMPISPFALSTPALFSSFIKSHLTAKHPRSSVDNTRAKTRRGCAAKLLPCKFASESVHLLL